MKVEVTNERGERGQAQIQMYKPGKKLDPAWQWQAAPGANQAKPRTCPILPSPPYKA